MSTACSNCLTLIRGLNQAGATKLGHALTLQINFYNACFSIPLSAWALVYIFQSETHPHHHYTLLGYIYRGPHVLWGVRISKGTQ